MMHPPTRTLWIRLGVAALAVFLLRLSAATLATAQTTDDAHDLPAPAIPRRVEIGGTAGMTVGIPEFGLLASVPLSPGSAVEVMVARMPAFWDAPPHLLAQVQVRVPFREHLRSRKSFVVGVTSITAQNGYDGFLSTDLASYVRPHAGVSLQWPTAPTLDFRLDLQGILTFEAELPVIPRAIAAFVWHPRTRR